MPCVFHVIPAGEDRFFDVFVREKVEPMNDERIASTSTYEF